MGRPVTRITIDLDNDEERFLRSGNHLDLRSALVILRKAADALPPGPVKLEIELPADVATLLQEWDELTDTTDPKTLTESLLVARQQAEAAVVVALKARAER